MRKDAKIDSPADLKGKRVGVPEYQQTAALWIRGALENEFGVAPKDMTFFMERLPSRSHAGAVGFKAPPGVTINQIPQEKGIGSMMVSGELDACMFYIRNQDLVDRSSEDSHNHPDIKPLFPDSTAEAHPLLQEDRHLPDQPRHGDQTLGRREESAGRSSTSSTRSIEANAIAEQRARTNMSPITRDRSFAAGYRKVLATQIITHGLKANRAMVEAAAKYSNQQGLTPRVVTVENCSRRTLSRRQIVAV